MLPQNAPGSALLLAVRFCVFAASARGSGDGARRAWVEKQEVMDTFNLLLARTPWTPNDGGRGP